MLNLQFSNFLVMTKNEFSSMDLRGRDNRYTDEGCVLLPIGEAVPVIVKGQGCLALAVIKSITIETGSTTYNFSLESVTRTTADAAFIMYQNAVAGGASISTSDGYDDDESMIPGVYRASTTNTKPKKSSSRYY